MREGFRHRPGSKRRDTGRGPYRPRTTARPSFRLVPAAEGEALPRPAREKPLRPLPAGPFAVPVSTIDWLVSRERPAARYVTLRDLLARSPKDIELRKARLAFSQDAFVRDLLPVLKRKLSPPLSAAALEQRYDGGLWLAWFLVSVGGDLNLPEVKRAGDVLFSRFERTFIALEREKRLPPIHALFWLACRALARMGHAKDPRIQRAAQALAGRVLASGEAGVELATGALSLFATLGAAAEQEPIRAAAEFAVERVLSDPPSRSVRLGFPDVDSDLLQTLDCLATLGVPRRPEIEPLLALVAAKADHRARWKLDRPPAGYEPIPVPLERAGELSRWVTIRALRVMQHFVGLTIEGVS